MSRATVLRWRRSAACRREALASIQPHDGQWAARIGGAVRGRVELFPSRAAAEQAVHGHYNRALLVWLRGHRGDHGLGT